MNHKEKIEWCIEQHHKTNHMYDTYLPYEFHLRMVAAEGEYWSEKLRTHHINKEIVLICCYGHDLIEDTRVTYNDICEKLGDLEADIIYALTNEKGRNRKERANDAYYQGIRITGGAIFIKLCDRIANIKYSKMTKSSMFKKYRQENPEFLDKVGADKYPEMKQYLIDLFNES